MATLPVRFELDDTIVLRGNDPDSDLFGRVERTYNALDSHDALEDCLIIAYVPVDVDIFRQFAATGRPPKGFLFVEFANEQDGHALLPEHNVELISRALSIGDNVKQHANTAMFGTVVDVQSKYYVSPRFSNIHKPVDSPYDTPLASVKKESILQDVLYEVDVDDLRRAEDFQSGDHVVSHDWFGLIESQDIDVAILLANMTIVWVERPWELGLLVTNPWDKPLVSMPELDGIRRPEVLDVDRNGKVTMPSKRLGCGDKVVTNKKNLEKGRWIVGQYDPDEPSQGIVLDVRTRKLDINWLVPNAFADASHTDMPPNTIRPYENLTSFRDPRDLRAKKDLTRYDHYRKPTPHEITNKSTHYVSSADIFYPGDRVRFRSSRNPQGTKMINITYEERNDGDVGVTSNGEMKSRVHLDNPSDNGSTHANNSEIHGARPSLLSRTETFGFDVNEYMVCWGYHRAVVLWQDGTESTMTSTELTPYSLPESDFVPGDLVMGKEGMRLTGIDAEDTTVSSDFNEMGLFEKDHVIQPTKVGVIQSIDGQERLVRVRWFRDPHIRISSFGNVLQYARFGQIGDDIEEMSSYEIMKTSVLVRKLGDFVVIPPGNPVQAGEPWNHFAAPDDFFATNPPGPTTLSYLLQTSRSIPAVLSEIAQPYFNRVHRGSPGPPMYDWLGEIIAFGLDGTITVRMGGMKNCQDVIMSHENILLLLDEDMMFTGPGEDMDVDSYEHEDSASAWEGDSIDVQSDEESAIDEVVEYEGGARLDDESGEDEWSTDEDMPESFVDAKETKDEDEREDVEMGGTDVEDTEDAVVHHRQCQNRQETEVSNTGTPLSSPRNEAVSAAEGPSLNLSSVPEEPVHAPGSVSLAQFLHQNQYPGNFEVLEQLPPSDQYCREEVPTQNPAFLKQIAREHRILASSLPPGEIYVRTYESRLDLLRCLIVGPADTPYEYCPFLIDLHLGPEFPKAPPSAYFHSWTSGLGRVNPNLYEEGKICLSLLGTWPGLSKQEGWSDKATILQLLVSLQGLVFVSRPFYNEAGFETYMEENTYSLESQQYSEKAYVIARGFAKFALLKAPGGLEDVVAWLYLCKSEDGADDRRSPRLLQNIIQRAKLLMERSMALKQLSNSEAGGAGAGSSLLIDGVGESADATKTFLKPLSQGAAVMLKKVVATLEETLIRYDSVQ